MKGNKKNYPWLGSLNSDFKLENFQFLFHLIPNPSPQGEGDSSLSLRRGPG
jgi:hypothetical protein